MTRLWVQPFIENWCQAKFMNDTSYKKSTSPDMISKIKADV